MKNKRHDSISSIEKIDERIQKLKDLSNQYSGDREKEIGKLLKIKGVLEEKNPYSLLGLALENLSGRPFMRDGKKVREGAQDKIDKLKIEYLIIKNKDLMSAHGPIKKYATKEGIKNRKRELESEILKITKDGDFDALKDAHLGLLIEHEKAIYRIAAYEKEIAFLFGKIEENYLRSRISAVENQKAGIKLKNQDDITSKKIGLGILKNNLGRDLDGNDFSHYVVVMEDPSLKQKNPKRSTSTLDEGDWDLATLRKYYADETGLTPTWNKKTASEIRNNYPKDCRKKMLEN